MLNYEEIEHALKELFQNVQTVPGTWPPVYTCDNFLIGFDGQGQIKVTGSITTGPGSSSVELQGLERWQERFLPSFWLGAVKQRLPESWLKRWFSERGRWVKATEAR